MEEQRQGGQSLLGDQSLDQLEFKFLTFYSLVRREKFELLEVITILQEKTFESGRCFRTIYLFEIPTSGQFNQIQRVRLTDYDPSGIPKLKVCYIDGAFNYESPKHSYQISMGSNPRE